MNDYLMIATVLKPQGVRGECKLRSYAADIDMFYQWKILCLKKEDSYVPVSVRVTRHQDDFVYAFLDGSSSAKDAERFRGVDLYVERKDTAPLDQNASLIADLIGCEAKDENGALIGTLTDVLQYGTVDTWVFKTPSGTLMAPALKNVFPDVDTESRTIRVISEKLEEVAVRS